MQLVTLDCPVEAARFGCIETVEMGFADSVDGTHLLMPKVVDIGEYAVALAAHALMAAFGMLMGERGHRVGGESMLLSVCTMTVQLLNP
ncbi:hypothetical protein, partial [Alistipes putredinis]|uniref:hypothetical protein n=1 Tax=Alistipes putredinis TaxID=28117 RepID=UPI003AB89A89